MITSRKDLKYYLQQDKKALGIQRKRPHIWKDEIWKFERLLRKTEYVTNCYQNTIFLPMRLFYKLRFRRVSIKLGFSIPLNVFEEGLSIAHYGTIVINGNAKIGKNCRIQEGVNIGSTGGEEKAPQIGNNVFIGTGAKIIGDIQIGNDVAIGANAVVTKSFKEDHITIAGVPAKKISDNDSTMFLNKLIK